MPTFVHKLRVSINSRFRDDQPGIVFVDLGGGFYQGSTITDAFKRAIKEHDFKAFHGDDASIQPGARDFRVVGAASCRHRAVGGPRRGVRGEAESGSPMGEPAS